VQFIRLVKSDARRRHQARTSWQERAREEVARDTSVIFKEVRADLIAAVRKHCIALRALKYLQKGAEQRRFLRGSIIERLPSLQAKSWSVGNFGVLLHTAQKRHGGGGRGYRQLDENQADSMWDSLSTQTRTASDKLGADTASSRCKTRSPSTGPFGPFGAFGATLDLSSSRRPPSTPGLPLRASK
jgi:hypothetical protein